MTEFKETVKNARKKLETSVAPANALQNYEELWEMVDPTKTRQNLRVFWKLMNPPECVWGIHEPSNHHEDHIAGKGDNALQHYNLVHKFTRMPQAMKIPAAKAAVDKEWEKLEKISAWNLTKVKSKKEVIDEARTWPGRRTRKGPEPACVQTPLCFEVAHAGGEG